MEKNSASSITLKGQLERILFSNEENGYTIAKLKIKGRTDLVTVVGTMTAPLVGQIVTAKGEWTQHPKFGEQFRANSCQCTVPASNAGIQKYLASGLIKGIGPVMAKRIVKRFGSETLKVIEDEPQRLTEVEGIGDKRIEMIKKAWEEQREIRQVMVFLQGYGISSTFAAKIFKAYGQDSIRIVRENPYRLATDIFGIGFLTADRIAQKIGFPKDSQFRIQAGLLYVLQQVSEDGHVYCPYKTLISRCSEILEVEKASVVHALEACKAEKQVVIEDFGHETEIETRVYLTKYHYSETSIASKLKRLISSPKSIRPIDSEKALDWVQKTYNIDLADKQKKAVKEAIDNKIVVITGGPGTGKSFLINAILKIISRIRARILLAAPTGRAAKRMNEVTGYEAKTIHRLLEFDFQKGGFKKDEDHPLNCDLLVLDEMSMVDTVLMHHLIKAVRLDTTVILVGDVNQLPSVGPGNVLKDIISSGSVPVVELSEIFRQAKQSSIVVNAHLINQGMFPKLNPQEGKLDDFYFMEEEEPEKVLEKIKYLLKERIPKRFEIDPVEHVQVVAPMNKGVVGVINLNKELQEELNPGGIAVTRGGRIFRVGDKVMQIKNNYGKEVFNGDIGKIISIDTELQEVKVSFEGMNTVYEYSDLDELVLAYAVSIHKSQGSDYPVVIFPILTQHYMMLQRNLIYTGITRGKRLVVMIGTKKALAIAVKNAKIKHRFTSLEQRLSS